jgi:hypothetical protein
VRPFPSRIFACLCIVCVLASVVVAPSGAQTASRIVTSSSAVPVPLYGASGVTVHYVNRFHYIYNPTSTSTPIPAAAPPSQIALNPASAIPASTAAPTAPTASQKPKPATASAFLESADLLKRRILARCLADIAAGQWPDAVTDHTTAANQCWDSLRSDTDTAAAAIVALNQATNVAIRNATAEQTCYAGKQKQFSAIILSTEQAIALLNLAQANATERPAGQVGVGCAISDSTAWPPDAKADPIETMLFQDQTSLTELASMDGFSDWSRLGTNAASIAALNTAVTSLLSEIRSYGKGTAGQETSGSVSQTRTAFQSTVDSNQQWRTRLLSISSVPGDINTNAEFSLTQDFNPCQEWYGRGRTDKYTAKVVDASSAAAQIPDLQLATNTCTPISIVSTGIGVSFLSNPTYAFVPNPAGAQVIGKTVDNTVTPLYGIFYNVKLPLFKPASGVELFVSPGIGLTSASSTITTDYLGGLSLSFGHRLLFLTASADFGQRTALQRGFTEGTAQGTLTSIPTYTTMKTGAMISVSFGIAPSL